MASAVAVAPVVDAPWLEGRLGSVVVADVRWSLDRGARPDAYLARHLPGAVFVDLDADLADPPSTARGRHPLPPPEAFAGAMGRRGIGDHDTVVAYDDAAGATAARLVWMLRVTGHPAALLDGGLAAWAGPTESGPVHRPPARFAVRPWPSDRLADGDAVASGTSPVVDARAAERYRGDVEPVDARPGHVPGAANLPYADNLDSDGRFLDPARLRRRFEATGVGTGAIVYCGSGVTACHTLVAMEHAGLPPGRLYAGSWSQWAADPDRPAATGAAP